MVARARWLGLGLGLVLLSASAAVAADIDVHGIADGAGVVVKAVDGQCSLIEAIENANSTAGAQNVDCANGDQAGPDTLHLPVNATFVLDDTSVPTPFPNPSILVGTTPITVGNSGLPPISSRLTILGNGSEVIREAAAALFRLFFVTVGGNLTLDALDLRGGSSQGPGGAVRIVFGTATLKNLTVENNATSSGAKGGGLYVFVASSLTVSRCAIVNNAAGSDGGTGGGIGADRPLSLLIEHSTISGNRASGGGGIHADVDPFPDTQLAVIKNSTIANNSGGGLLGTSGGGLAINENLFVGNEDYSCRSTFGLIMSASNNPSITDTAFELLCIGGFLDPALAGKVAPLADNGGGSNTHALLPGSEAIDLAINQCDEFPELDQRGTLHDIDGEQSDPMLHPRPLTFHCDLGAYESLDVYDYGDAPAPYPSVLDAMLGAQNTSGGALHEIGIRPDDSVLPGVVYLGACVDGDAKPTAPSSGAVDDDGNTGARVIGTCATAGDDEDGISIPATLTDAGAHDITVTTPAGQKAVLDGWIDFTRDGDWDDPGEKVIDGVAVTGGVQTFPIVVPASFSSGGSYARFRISTGGLDTAAGFSGNGEVEDYAVTLQDLQICGDAFLDTNEDCDLGVTNGTAGSCCSADCNFRSSADTCRPSAGVCDPAETCTGSSSSCPADLLALAAEVCRPTVGTCDVVENCTGSSAACPDDVVNGSEIVCRAASAICDVAENCTGESGLCPENLFQPPTTVCNPSADECDIAENCTGNSASCPAEAFAPSSQLCRAAAGVCDLAENCSGSAASCPANALAPSTQQCRGSAGVCDVAENCSGSSTGCPDDVFAASSQVCRPADGACDAAESCTGSSAACPGDLVQPADTECRVSSEECDPAEVCDGSSSTCPPNSTCPDDPEPDCDEIGVCSEAPIRGDDDEMFD